MSNFGDPIGRGPAQTIVIERPRRGCLFGAAMTLLVCFFVFIFLIVGLSMVSRESGLLPTKLSERYVAGEMTPSASKIAIVDVNGLIMDENVDHVVRQIHQARDDTLVKAVVLRVDSPGGTVSGSDRIWREVQILKEKGKPVVVSMGGLAASGGYYVSAPGDMIFAEPTTITGSIGVIAEFPHIHELLKKVGVDFDTITTGEWKDAGSMFRPMTETERKRWHELIDDSYERFVRIVAQGRKLPLSEVKALANGKVYTAHEARDLKLVNALGYLEDAIADAQKRASLTTFRAIRYAKPIDLRTLLMGVTNQPAGVQIDRQSLMEARTPQLLMLMR